jgi:ribonuclease P protein component
VKRRYRLTRSADIKRVRRFGRSYADPLFVLVMLSNRDERLRIAVVASKSIGGAVLRNRARRRLKACLDDLLPSMRRGWDLVFFTRPAIVDVAYCEIKTGLTGLLEQTGLLVER